MNLGRYNFKFHNYAMQVINQLATAHQIYIDHNFILVPKLNI